MFRLKLKVFDVGAEGASKILGYFSHENTGADPEVGHGGGG